MSSNTIYVNINMECLLNGGLHLCRFVWSQEWNISRSPTDREIKENRESWNHSIWNAHLWPRIQLLIVCTPSLCPPQTHQMLFIGVLSCVLMSKCMSVLKRWRKEVRSCQTVMARAVWMFGLFCFFCIAWMHLFDGSGCFIINSSHIRFHGLSYCCSVGKF